MAFIEDKQTFVRNRVISCVLAGGFLGVGVLGGNPLLAQTSYDFAAVPPLLQASAPPRVMLLMSNDQQQFYKAYTDYTDLDGDGQLDTSYKDTIEYYGYFNSNFCYDYDAADARFEPNGITSGGHQCNGQWSGNFLNWASMTRMDIVRRVFYGGKRVVDTSTETVLQRALLPNDAHAFVKVYEGTDIGSYTPNAGWTQISLCNVTKAASGLSGVSTEPPLLRVVQGSYPQWASTAVIQCMVQGEAALETVPVLEGEVSRPPPGTDYIVNVQACVAGQDAELSDYCRDYGSVYKPAGILQENSEDGAVHFGLMTGTHEQKMSGGILRRNIKALAGNVDANENEVDVATGQFRAVSGIVKTLDSMRIAGWDYQNHKYVDCNRPGITVADYKADINAGELCRDWGNPLAEMYLEALRYFADKPVTSDFSAGDDSSLVTGMSTEAWVDPLPADRACAQCAIIVLSTGLNSFDADELSGSSDLPGLSGSTALPVYTNGIGTNEGLPGLSVIVGNDGSTNNNICDAKTLGNFSDILGICPELPSLEGSYHLAGLANYAQTQDLRPEADLPDMQNIDTYTIALAESLPSFEFTTRNAEKISIVPVCQSTAGGVWTNCSIVDATVVTTEAQTPGYTRVDIAWEDSLWGHDYDMDGVATIEVCTAGADAKTACQYKGARVNNDYTQYVDWAANPSGSVMEVRISVPEAHASRKLRFGFTVAGSLNDGTVFNAERPGSKNYSCYQEGASGLDGICQMEDSSSAIGEMVWAAPALITAGSSTARFLENPLWYAAKYGNFQHSDTKGVPTLPAEWDLLDLDGNSMPDGIPDAYFPVSNPGQLAKRLNRIVSTIEQRSASGTSVAVTLERRDGVGATFQAYYFPTFEESNSNIEVQWVGGLHALFLDGDLNLREDSNTNAELDADDLVIQLLYDGTSTVVRRSNLDGTTTDVPFTQIKPIWDAKDWLADLSNSEVINQRLYTSALGRYIFTWMDRDQGGGTGPNGSVDSNEVVAFTRANVVDNGVVNNAYRILGVADAASGADLVNYIRGSDSVAGVRSRTVITNHSVQRQVWRLGDIIHSSPVVVGRPDDDYDIRYRDQSFATYRKQYLDRRQVIYVGANDGMIHAFNAGFYEAGSAAFTTSGGNSETEYALGAELWAYVPRNLLPHLRWLTEKNYPHVYYVDGEPKAYDVNIFTPDAAHPGGWGTILVVGFRFGGGDIELDLDATPGTDFTSRSAYVILDITDPESPPRLLAEISDENLGYTTSIPTLIKGRLSELVNGTYPSGTDAWYLAFGSGPAGTNSTEKKAALDEGISYQNARFYVFNLNTLQFEDMDSSTTAIDAGLNTGVANSFVGDPSSVDWNRDYLDDAVYFGLVAGLNVNSPSGSLQRLRFELAVGAAGTPPRFTLGSDELSTLLDPGLPFQGAPVAFFDLAADRQWVLAGTGRYLAVGDNDSDYANRFYGVMEPLTSVGAFSYAEVPEIQLANTTSLAVLKNETVYDVSVTPAASPATLKSEGGATIGEVLKLTELMPAIRSAGGWYNDLGKLTIGYDGFGAAITSAESRNYNGAVTIGTGVGFVKYAPDKLICTPAGYSSLRFVDARTGTASRGIFYQQLLGAYNNVAGDVPFLDAESDVMQGAISKLTLVRTTDGAAVGVSDNYGGIHFEKVGFLPPLGFRQSWRELPISP